MLKCQLASRKKTSVFLLHMESNTRSYMDGRQPINTEKYIRNLTVNKKFLATYMYPKLFWFKDGVSFIILYAR